jgi:hypothetical protein
VGTKQLVGVALVAVGLLALVAGVVGVLMVDPGEDAEPAPTGVTAAAPTGPTSAAPTGPTSAGPTGPTAATAPTGPTATGPAREPQTPEEFFGTLAAAFAEGDGRFLFMRLHPATVERYGAAQCRGLFATFEFPEYSIEVLSVGDVGPFDYETDGLSRRIDGATSVRIRFTEDGTTFIETDSHIVLDAGRYRWLTDCGTPLEGAA